MKRYFYLSVLGTALAMTSGCATSKFRPYSGAQQDWPTSPGSFIETNSSISTYFGLPPKPYEVLGYLDATTAPIRRSGVVSYAASRAKALGGDAIIVLREGSEYAGTFSFGSANTSADVSGYSYGNNFHGSGSATTTYNTTTVPRRLGKASVIVIKFKTQDTLPSNTVKSDTLKN